MKFDKYAVSLKLAQEGVGRKQILEEIYNRRMFNHRVEIENHRKKLSALGVKVISSNEPIYPKILKQIYDYPLLLFCKGDVSLLQKKKITIVGTRDMSNYGRWSVGYILRALKKEDVVIVSGLANGIDVEVHKVCLKLKIPTISVVAGGIDRGYPKSNQAVYDEICSQGLVISEFPPGRKITKGMFPMRNRILAGISSATVVIESDIRGGSLITMNLALEYGRDIFCVPCNISRYSLQGCNMSIAQGATPLFDPSELVSFCKERCI